MSYNDEWLLSKLTDLEHRISDRGDQLALALVFDRPERQADRPALAKTFFAQRCASNKELTDITEAFRSIGAYVKLFEGELPLLKALADGSFQEVERPLKVIYNGIEGGIGFGAFQPGRKALIPAVSDAYGLASSNSSAYACSLGRHKFHYFTVLRALGVPAPETWHFRPEIGWAGGRRPAPGTKVIVKSTYESWAVGVSEDSIFEVGDNYEGRVAGIAEEIGQAVTVQEFVAGAEVCVPVLSGHDRLVTPLIETVLKKSPGNPEAVTTIQDNLLEAGIQHRRFEGGPDLDGRLVNAASRAFDVLELESFARIDFRVAEDESIWATDIGVSPGISDEDSSFRSFELLGFSHPEFLRIVVAATLDSHGLLD